jgi:diguanylate cyclase (GGDEF)-like protein/putative nucleotidyltransferase with HDIG domain
LAGALGALYLPRLGPATDGWRTFALLGIAAAASQLFIVITPRNQSYQTSIVFLLPAVFLLPPELAVLLPFAQHVPEWLKVRYPWYIPSFNIANHTLNVMAGLGVARLVLSAGPDSHALWGAAGLAACAAFVGSNHLLLAGMLRLARGHSPRATGLFTVESLSTDLVLAALGVALAFMWSENPWLIVFAVAPLVLIHRSLAVPQLQEEARVDPKTGLFNARHFGDALAAELRRAERFGHPLSLIMADLDLLREVNNEYGHLAGDVVLKGVADIFHSQLRDYDVPARFGGEEFAILLPETSREQALEIGERIRSAVGAARFDVSTSAQPIAVTISVGVANCPDDGTDANSLIHQADLAVYRAKLQGRNRVLAAGAEPLAMPAKRAPRLATMPSAGAARVDRRNPAEERRRPRPSTLRDRPFVSMSSRLAALVSLVGVAGIAAGAAGAILGSSQDVLGLLAVVLLVGVGQALAVELDHGSISVSAVGALAGAALFGPRAALPLAVTAAMVEWSARRAPAHQVLFNVGTLSLASLAAAAVFTPDVRDAGVVVLGFAAGTAYFAVNTGLLSWALALEGGEPVWRTWRDRFGWLAPHFVAYGFVAGVIFIAYEAVGLYALAVFAVPVLLTRRTQAAYVDHTQKNARRLRRAAETIQTQNVSLERANRLLRERSTAAMESLSATVDARDDYTSGHSRRVQRLALAVGRELELSQPELDLLGHAALFHDIGKLAIPDAVLLKPGSLTSKEWRLMKRHSDEGARIIERLGFLSDAVPAIRHHHERFDGTGYPDGLKGTAIPLGARIIHVADALDSMLTNRVYQPARGPEEALAELRNGSGSQFCPRCVAAIERVFPLVQYISHAAEPAAEPVLAH